LPVDPVLPVTVLTAPLLTAPLLTGPLLVDPLPPVPVLFDPTAGPSDGESVGLVLAPPEPGELDAGVAGVEGPLPGVDEDAGALGLAALDCLAVLAGHGVAVALADAVPPLPLLLAFAEAVEVAALMAVAVPAGALAVVVSPGLVLPLAGLSLVPLSVALSDGLLAGLAGVSLGVADVVGLACLARADDAEPDPHAIADTPLWAAEVPPPAPPVAEPTGVPSPFVL
jgi:hypothetical protein